MHGFFILRAIELNNNWMLCLIIKYYFPDNRLTDANEKLKYENSQISLQNDRLQAENSHLQQNLGSYTNTSAMATESITYQVSLLT